MKIGKTNPTNKYPYPIDMIHKRLICIQTIFLFENRHQPNNGWKMPTQVGYGFMVST